MCLWNPATIALRVAEVKKDGCLTSRESGEEGECIALVGNTQQEVIHIILQKVFWIVSIAWIVLQAWNQFCNKKK